MKNPLPALGARQDAGDTTGEMPRRRRQPVTAARGGWTAATSGRRKRHGTREFQAVRGPVDPIVVTLVTGLAVEVVLPWAVIWLSNMLYFDVPAWSLWLIFGVPPALTLLAVLVLGAHRFLGRQPMRVAMPARQGR